MVCNILYFPMVIYTPSTSSLLRQSHQHKRTGALIVTTPHTLALQDAARGIRMFETVGVPITGLVQNMSLFKCPHCGGATHVFGDDTADADEATGGVRHLCKTHGIDILADIPLHPRIGGDGQSGRPTVVAEPGSERAELFMGLAKDVAARIGLS